MTQESFLQLINSRIEVAQESLGPPTIEFYKLIQDHILTLKNLRDNTSSDYEDVVIPPFPAI